MTTTPFTLASVRALTGRIYRCFLMESIGTKLSRAERKEFDAAMADAGISHRAIVKALRNRAIRVSTTTVARHRRGECMVCR